MKSTRARKSAANSKTSLREYRAKRNFSRSPEPSGSIAPTRKREKARIFCVQKHLATQLHYDFRLEYNGVLLSWAVPKGPSLNPSDKRLAMRVEDHPRDYADFEGVIPEGYGAGVVMLWDTGTWTPESEDIDAALRKGQLKFKLDGVKLKGSWVIVRMGDSKTWLLIKHRDEWAGEIDIAEFAPKSVKSDLDFEGILYQEKPEIWRSHREGNGNLDESLLKIVQKVEKLKSKAGPTTTSTQRRRGYRGPQRTAL